MTRVWLITGASSGFGEVIALKALAEGDRVVATSRSINRLEKLKSKGAAVVQLDQNQPYEHVQSAVNEAIQAYGTIDVVVNNAAYVQIGSLEEASPEDVQRQFLANVFGPLNIYRAILPNLRAKRSGLLATIGSLGAWYPWSGANLYTASKAAIRMIGLGLEGEISGFGISHCLIEAGFFRTEILNSNLNLEKSNIEGRLPDYAELNATIDSFVGSASGNQPGDPVKGGEVIYEVLTSTGVAKGKAVPSYLPLGSDCVNETCKRAEDIIRQAKEWAEIAALSDSPKA